MIAFLAATTLLVAAHTPAHNCQKTYTGPMITRGIDAAYSGTRGVTPRDRARLRRYIRCARPHVSRKAMRRYLNHARHAWSERVADSHMYNAWASWYSLSGSGACGTGAQVGYHVAHKTLPCGTRIKICREACVIAVVADRGPYVAGREFDLNVNVRNVVGCPGVCLVRYRIL